MDFGLRGKRALVTGGSHGIGLGISEALVREGAAVAILGRDENRLEAARKSLVRQGGEVLTLKADALIQDEIDDAWTKIHERWGGIDILVNNVGGGGRWGHDDILETGPEVWSQVYQKNAGVAIQLTKLALPAMLNKKWGRVVTVTSIYGAGIGGRPWFNIAKVAQTVLMKNLARRPELVRAGITFNSVAPGGIYIPDTGWEELEKTDPTEFSRLVENLPLGRMGTPAEVGNLVAFLSSDKASYINGSSIVVDGGETVHLE